MNSITRGIQAVSALILVLVAPMSLSVAQEPGRQGGSSPAPPAMEELDRMTTPERGGKDMEERIRHFEAKRREKLLQALQLDEATRTRLTQRLAQLDQKAQDLRRQRQEAVQALREQAKGLRKEMRRGQRNGGGGGPGGAPPAGGRPGAKNAVRPGPGRDAIRRDVRETFRDGPGPSLWDVHSEGRSVLPRAERAESLLLQRDLPRQLPEKAQLGVVLTA